MGCEEVNEWKAQYCVRQLFAICCRRVVWRVKALDCSSGSNVFPPVIPFSKQVLSPVSMSAPRMRLNHVLKHR